MGRAGLPSRLRRAAPWGAWRLALVSLLLSASCAWPHEVPRGSPSTMVRQAIEGPAPEVVLMDQAGQPLALRNLRGKVVLLTFIYSACADVCPLITAAMTGLQQHLTARERPDVFFLSVTVEPEVDTPAVLRAYAEHHGADLTSWAFLTGNPPAVQAVWHAFGLTVKRRAEGVVDHPAWTFLIDREGLVHYRYIGSVLEMETMVADIRRLGAGAPGRP
jgi:protein SCO1